MIASTPPLASRAGGWPCRDGDGAHAASRLPPSGKPDMCQLAIRAEGSTARRKSRCAAPAVGEWKASPWSTRTSSLIAMEEPAMSQGHRVYGRPCIRPADKIPCHRLTKTFVTFAKVNARTRPETQRTGDLRLSFVPSTGRKAVSRTPRARTGQSLRPGGTPGTSSRWKPVAKPAEPGSSLRPGRNPRTRLPSLRARVRFSRDSKRSVQPNVRFCRFSQKTGQKVFCLFVPRVHFGKEPGRNLCVFGQERFHHVSSFRHVKPLLCLTIKHPFRARFRIVPPQNRPVVLSSPA